MRKTLVSLGIISALVLSRPVPALAGDKSISAQGMFSAGEMRTSIKSGGTFTSGSNVVGGGTQARYGGVEKSQSASIANANTVNKLNTKGYSSGSGKTVILSGPTSAAAKSAVVTAPGSRGTAHAYDAPFLPETSAEGKANTAGNAASSSPDALILFRQDPDAQTGNTEETVVVSRNRTVSKVVTRGNEKKRPSIEDPLDLSR